MVRVINQKNIMLNYLNNRTQLFTLLTVISFLFVYVSGEKIGTFVFMLLLMYPLLIADGSFGILSLNINHFSAIFIDVLFLILIYSSIYCLIRSSIKSRYNKIPDKYKFLSLLTLYLFIGKIISSSVMDVFSLITISTFLFFSIITLFIVGNRLIKGKKGQIEVKKQ